MESIDSYIQRKTKQIDTYRSAVKELKVLVLKNFKMDYLKSKVLSRVTWSLNYFPFQNLADKTKQKQLDEIPKVGRTISFWNCAFRCINTRTSGCCSKTMMKSLCLMLTEGHSCISVQPCSCDQQGSWSSTQTHNAVSQKSLSSQRRCI